MITAESAVTRYWLREDGIVIGRDINTDIYRTAAVTNATLDVLAELSGPEKRPALWDPRAFDRIHAEGWLVLVERLPAMVTALAILVDDDVEPLLGTFPQHIDALFFPVRLFREEEQAIEWLRGFLDTPPASPAVE